MSTAETLFRKQTAPRGEDFEYRSINAAAIGSLTFGLLSIIIFVAGRDGFQNALLLSPLPMIGLGLGISAMATMRASPGQFTGGAMAKVGSALSIVCLVGGLTFAGYVYATEAPDGYERTSFYDFKPDDVDLRGDHAVPPDVAALDGKKVFIKGYIRPDSIPFKQNVKQFLLVRDNNNCCFGDLSSVKYYDQIAVFMQDGRTVDYSPGLFRMGGTLRVYPENAGETTRGPAYVLEADYAQ